MFMFMLYVSCDQIWHYTEKDIEIVIKFIGLFDVLIVHNLKVLFKFKFSATKINVRDFLKIK